MKTTTLFAFLMLYFGVVSAQDFIELRNPSFEEDEPRQSLVPTGWVNLGASDMTAPDIQPGFWGVDLPPQDGSKYLGLVVRDNNTFEGVGQLLDGELRQGRSYEFKVWLAHSKSLVSYSQRLGTGSVFYDAPTTLTIWGTNTETESEELLAFSQPVNQEEWLEFTFTMTPAKGDYNMIKLVAAYSQGYLNKNGNLLIDNCSDIVRIAK